MKITKETIKSTIDYLTTNNTIESIMEYYTEKYFEGYYITPHENDDKVMEIVDINSNTGILDEFFQDIHTAWEDSVMEDVKKEMIEDGEDPEDYDMMYSYLDGYVWTQVGHSYNLSKMLYDVMITYDTKEIEEAFEECDTITSYRRKYGECSDDSILYEVGTKTGYSEIYYHLEDGTFTTWCGDGKDCDTIEEVLDYITETCEKYIVELLAERN